MQPVQGEDDSGEGAGIRDRIIEAAGHLFRVQGYAATSLNDIGGLVGLTAPALSYYFGSKSNLLFESLRGPLQDQIATCRAATTGKTPPEQLTGFVEALVNFLLALPFVQEVHGGAFVSIGVLAKSLPADQRTEVLALLKAPVDDVRAILTAGRKSGDFRDVDPTMTAFAILGLAENVTWVRPKGRLTALHVAQSYGDLALAMVRA
jgi:AcrR family transcriptional regulator